MKLLIYLTLARISYFAILDRTWVGGWVAPPARLPLIEIELRNKDKRNDRDVLNLTIPDFTTSGHILTFPGQVKPKNVFLENQVFLQITFELREIERNAKRHRIPLVKTHGSKYIVTPKDQFENLTFRSGQMS